MWGCCGESNPMIDRRVSKWFSKWRRGTVGQVAVALGMRKVDVWLAVMALVRRGDLREVPMPVLQALGAEKVYEI